MFDVVEDSLTNRKEFCQSQSQISNMSDLMIVTCNFNDDVNSLLFDSFAEPVCVSVKRLACYFSRLLTLTSLS